MQDFQSFSAFSIRQCGQVEEPEPTIYQAETALDAWGLARLYSSYGFEVLIPHRRQPCDHCGPAYYRVPVIVPQGAQTLADHIYSTSDE